MLLGHRLKIKNRNAKGYAEFSNDRQKRECRRKKIVEDEDAERRG